MYMYAEKGKGYKEGEGIVFVAFISTWTICFFQLESTEIAYFRTEGNDFVTK